MRSVAAWVLALLVTLGAAVWQRLSGPTHPVRGTVQLEGETVRVRLVRSGVTGVPLAVRIVGASEKVGAEVAWRRFPTGDAWRVDALQRGQNGALEGALPTQPPAGKVEYQVRLRHAGGDEAVFPERPAVARFKGAVSPWFLGPHIALMFCGMMWATRTGLSSLRGTPSPGLVRAALVMLGVGGLVLGPLVQLQAFGALWTGWPFGNDLTDNKTLVAVLAWGWAAWRLRRGHSARWAVLVAAVLTLAVFSIPHSTWGSELRWDEVAPAG